MIPETIKKKIEQGFPLDDPRKNMFHDNSGQYLRREAAEYGYLLSQEEIARLEGLIEKAFKTFHMKPFPHNVPTWEDFKSENNL